MGVINLTIQGEMVKFAEPTESLSASAESASSAPEYPQGETVYYDGLKELYIKGLV